MQLPPVVIATVAATLVARLTAHAEVLSQTSNRLKTRVVEQSHELESTKDALVRAERLAELGHLAASVGHEINNPLACVVANIDFVREEVGARASGELADALSDAAHASNRIKTIVDELRAHGRSDDGEETSTCAPHEAIEDATRIVRPSLEGIAAVDVSLETAPRVELRVRKLSQVIVNLTMNAAQAMPAACVQNGSGFIAIVAGRDASGNAFIRVRDDGTGMDELTRSKIFEPFFTTKTAGQGVGLGLHVSSSIVREAGGTVRVESELGVGTIITVVLPAARNQGAIDGMSPEAPGPPGREHEAARVLIIDDEAAVGRSIMRVLRGHCVDHVLSVPAGKEALRERSYDVILCDLMMPDGGGAELYRSVAAESPALAERFVFITGGATTSEAALFLDAPGRRVLTKPLETRGLRELVASTKSATRERISRA